jgi:hypothetical protein
LASSGDFELLIIFITLSKLSTATDKPINICALSSAFFKLYFVLFTTTSFLKFKKFSKKSFKEQVLGLFSTIANVLNPKELSKGVNLYNCLFIVSGSTFLLKSIETLIPS